MINDFKYIYGPVYSWRTGVSLGVDPISCKDKICTFDCIYCQLGKTGLFTAKRQEFVPCEKIIKEIKSLPAVKIDYITFSGRGEPTLAINLGQIISQIKKIRKEKIAVITNASLIHRTDVQRDLSLADFVIAKLDVCSEDLFMKVNRPMKGMRFNVIVEGLKSFRENYKGRLALQIMFIKENKRFAKKIAKIVKDINPDDVHVNTPLRKCSVQPLSNQELGLVKGYFKGLNVICVYDVEKRKVKVISSKRNILKRHGR